MAAYCVHYSLVAPKLKSVQLDQLAWQMVQGGKPFCLRFIPHIGSTQHSGSPSCVSSNQLLLVHVMAAAETH